MPFPFYWIDAFTDRVFGGNPAGVVPLMSWPDDAVMQGIAFENGLAETAFFVRTGEARYHLRWFTPTVEIDLCGHATLASGHVLYTQLGYTGELVTFDTLSGPLTVRRRPDRMLELDFPSRPGKPGRVSTALTRALGERPVQVAQARDTLCVFDSADDVLALRPDFAALARLDTFGVIATAPGQDCDFVSRFFVPKAGINEDPVTGSAHCTLTPYWAARLGKTKLHARQVSARGGELWCEQARDRVKIAGRAALYLKGEIHA
ncbi:MAG TPA: PhzF family phenazine biosynthesis protein [Lacunisphaera sp.]|nr:PhzF family phenazine biosynthesis protein [Lacunisphaera sp.]